MPEKQRIVVVGLGRFGTAVAEGLHESGHDVLAIDDDADVVQRAAETLPHVVQANGIEEQALRGLSLGSFDGGVVAVTDNLEVSILATLLLKRLGVPRLVAKARGDLHAEILTRVGADHVVFPERDSGRQLARTWSARTVTAAMDVVEGYVLERFVVPPELVGKPLEDVASPERGTALLCLARGSRVTANPSPRDIVHRGDVLVIGGDARRLDAFFAGLGAKQP